MQQAEVANEAVARQGLLALEHNPAAVPVRKIHCVPLTSLQGCSPTRSSSDQRAWCSSSDTQLAPVRQNLNGKQRKPSHTRLYSGEAGSPRLGQVHALLCYKLASDVSDVSPCSLF